MTEQMGYHSRLSIGGNVVAFVSQDIKETREIVDDDGLRGTRTRALERVAQGNIKVAGSITMQPTPAELSAVLPYVLGNGANSFVLSDALPDVTVIVDQVTALYTYVGRFTSAELSGEPGKKITLKMNFVGKSLVVSAGGSLTAAPDAATRPFMFYDAGSGIEIGGANYSIDKFSLNIDNKIEPTYMNGQTATDLEPTDRVITLGIQTKYTATEAGLFTSAQLGPAAGAPETASIAFTNGSSSFSFTFAALVAVSESVTTPGRQHLRLPLNYHCYGVSTTKELTAASS